MEEATNGKRRTLKVKAFGVEVEIRGYDIVILLVLVGVVALIVSNYYIKDSFANEHRLIVENQKLNFQKNEEQLSEIVYLLSLSEKEKIQLRLKVPNSLKEKIERKSQ